jgi:hypothetical protein
LEVGKLFFSRYQAPFHGAVTGIEEITLITVAYGFFELEGDGNNVS